MSARSDAIAEAVEEHRAQLAAAILAAMDELIADCDDGATNGYYRAAMLVARARLVRTIDHFLPPHRAEDL